MKKLIYILSVCAIVALIVVVLILNKKSTAEKTRMVMEASTEVAVKMIAVTDTAYSMGFTSNGVLQALRDLQFMSDVSGRVIGVYADEGSRVGKGKVLVQLDNEMLRADVVSSEAAYNGLKKDYERFKNANVQGGVSDQQLDNIRTQMIAAESRLITSKKHLADASIKSPITGSIYRRYVEVGSYVNLGAKLFDIIDDSQLKAMCFATEKQRLNLTVGQSVTVKSETFPDKIFQGEITFISDKADRSLNFPIEVTLTGDKQDLKSGMFVTVLFNIGAMKNGILIPRNAIVGSVQAANVFVVKNGTAKKQKVVAGDMVGEQIEILQGLQPADSVIVAGLINVTDGVKVKNIQ
ncbi:MAG: Multidrug resistance protein MdtE precursor [Bacteroidetes bacterium ADurb.BinA174]|nr:MAG: Multidrug resistance protein MdtE precursor [Bacteroidetes bacterium ADurb.BinA174]